jgi:hypothetical protein
LAQLQFSNLRAEIRTFSELPRNWDSFGSEPISEQAINNALGALERMYARSLSPDRVDPSSDESIIFEIRRDDKTLLLEFFSNGEIAGLRKQGSQRNAFDLSADELDQFIDDSL